MNRRYRGILLLLTAILVYLPSLGNRYVFDDVPAILENPNVQQLSPRVHFLEAPFLPELDYRPVLQLSWALDHALGGGEPFVYHATSILLHALASLLLFLLLGNLPGTRRIAGWSALLFAVHPVYAEAVHSIAWRGELLTAVFGLGGLLLYDHARRSSSHRTRALMLTGSWLSLFLAFASKESGVFLVLGPMILDSAFPVETPREGRRTVRWRWISLAPLTGLALHLWLCRAATGRVLRQVSPQIWDCPTLGEPLEVRLLTAAAALWTYLRRLVIPIDLFPDYSMPAFPPRRELLDPAVLAGAALTALLLAAVWILERRRTGGAAWGLLVLAALPYGMTSNVLFPVFAMANRYLYLPNLFFLPLVLLLGDRLAERLPIRRHLLTVLGALLVLALASLTMVDSLRWRDDLTLFRSAAQRGSRSAKVHYNYALAAARQGQSSEALKAVTEAIRLRPAYRDALILRAGLRTGAGLLAAALEDYDRLVAFLPDNPGVLSNRGQLRLAMGDPEGAARDFEAALESVPGYYYALMGRAQIRIQQGRLEEAAADVELALQAAGSPPPQDALRLQTRIHEMRRAESTPAALQP